MYSDARIPVLDLRVSSRVFNLDDGQRLHAVGQLAFALQEHSFTCIVGPSGCGKTTVLRMILGLDSAFEGSINQPDRERVAAVFQEPRLLPWRTVEQNVRLVLPPHRLEESLDELFKQLGLNEVRALYPTQLSLGLARRAALARAFVLQPQLLILDEPFVSLDAATAERLRLLLIDLWQTHQTTALMVTHDLQEAVTLADRILVFSDRPATLLGEVEVLRNRAERDRDYIESVERQVDAIRVSVPEVAI